MWYYLIVTEFRVVYNFFGQKINFYQKEEELQRGKTSRSLEKYNVEQN